MRGAFACEHFFYIFNNFESKEVIQTTIFT